MDFRDEIKEFFSHNGILNKYSENFEYRESQLRMALSVYDSLETKSHLIVEAPTGIGKSFAYLVPAIYYAISNKRKAIISTHTINLQEQIIGKDIPFLQKILEVDFKASLLKGKTNYICPKRLRRTMENTNSLFETDEQVCLEKIYSWSRKTSDGTVSDIDFRIEPTVWSSVCAEVGICSNKTCGSVEETECFYQKARHKVSESDIVVLNHHLFFTLFEGTLKEDSEGYLYKNDFIIFDEAHTVEAVAAEHIMPSVSREMIKYHLLRLYNDRKKKGFLLAFPALHVLPVVQNLLDLNQSFFYGIKRKLFNRQGDKYDKLAVRIFDSNITDNILKDELNILIDKLRELRQFSRNEIEENELQDYIIRFGEFNILIDNYLEQQNKDLIYWAELASHNEDANVWLCASPTDISDYLRSYIFKPGNSTVLTSATLSIGDNFDYFKGRIGAETADSVKLPTQFDFYNQVKVYIPNDRMLTPQKETSDGYIQKLAEWIYYFIKMTEGKALVLFTNSFVMKQTGVLLRDYSAETGFEILIQGENLSRKLILDKFRSDINSVLLGLDSFWLGIDVPGEALSNLIITRLPFYVPDHPLTQARLEKIDLSGGNSFMDYSLPEAILKFRQGIGRLIRNKNDRGIVAVLDNRILNKSYGRHFLNSIDECPVEIL